MNRQRLVKVAHNILGDWDIAEDVFQDSLLKAMQKAPLLEEDQLLAWYYRVLKNAALDHLRKQNTEKSRLNDVIVLFEEKEEAVKTELCECFKPLLTTLKPEYKELIETIDLEGKSNEDVSAKPGIDRNNLKVRHFRAREQLRRRLEESCRACAQHGCLDCNCAS